MSGTPSALPGSDALPGLDPAAGPATAAALERLETLGDQPVPEHVEVFDAVHRSLQDALASLDEG